MPVRRKIRKGRPQDYRKAKGNLSLFAANSTWSTYSWTNIYLTVYLIQGELDINLLTTYIYLTLRWNHYHELALTWTGVETRSKMRCRRSDVFEQQGAVYEIWRRTVVVVLRQWAVYLLNIAMKSFSWTGTHLNWRWNSKQDAVWKIWGVRTASCGAEVLMCLIGRIVLRQCAVHSGPLKARPFTAQSIMVRWKRGCTTEQSIMVRWKRG